MLEGISFSAPTVLDDAVGSDEGLKLAVAEGKLMVRIAAVVNVAGAGGLLDEQ